MSTTIALHVGLISDTHGLLRPQAVAALRGCNRIVHAGDVGDPGILAALAEIAPVTAVRGNNDRGPWAAALPETGTINIGEVRIYVLHNLADLDIDPAKFGCQAVISGHSHRPKSESRNGVLFVNPGSAGPRRFSLPVSVGRLVVTGATVTSQLLELEQKTLADSRSQRESQSSGKNS
ncbi:MAG: metallophosphoesterase family protein [Burkholderiales bacterium]